MNSFLIKRDPIERESYWAILGFSRFILASAVFFHHIYQHFASQNTGYIASIARSSGLVSVIAFLLISGYSIASSFSRQQQGFYRRRFIRVIPLYVLAIIFSCSIQFIPHLDWQFEYPSMVLSIGNLLLLQGFLVGSIQTNPVVWTLSIEIFFYVLTPFFYYLQNQGNIFPVICMSTLLVCTYKVLSRYFFPQMPGFQDLLFCQGAILLAWSWLLGFYFFFIKSNRHVYYFLVPGILAVSVIYLKDLTGLIIYLLTCLLLIYGTRLKLAKKIRVVFSRLGDISYPLYVFISFSITYYF